jgi:hypothetical protein
VLRQRHLEGALKKLEEIEKEFPHAFAEMHTNPYSDYDINLVAVLERVGGQGWVQEQRLRKAMMHQGGDRRFIEARDTLKAAGEIEVRRTKGEPEWRRVFSSGRLLRGAVEERKKGGPE